MRRWVYLVHRWLGIASCLLFAMWFLSGLVMMYVQFPALTAAERLAGLSPLRLDEAVVGPAMALAVVSAQGAALPPRSIVLETLADQSVSQPVWRIVDARGRRQVVSARDGRLLGPVDARQAQAVASAFSGRPGARWVQTLERDQWTVPQSLDALRPLHRIEVGDALGTELYVSAVTGEVVRDTTRAERGWNWVGAYPTGSTSRPSVPTRRCGTKSWCGWPGFAP